MTKIFSITAVFLLLSVQQVFAFSPYLKSIDVESQEAVLIDKDTDEEYIVTEGDEIEGWTVGKIKADNVVLKKAAEDKNSQTLAIKLYLPNKATVMQKQ